MSLQLGFFMVESGAILVSDPCHSDAEYMHLTLPAHNGKWWTSIETIDDRVSCLYAVLEKPPAILIPLQVGTVGVDSGQMGIYDKSHFNNPKSVEEPLQNFDFDCGSDWYLMCCNRTLNETSAGLIPHGVVSSTGLGDGAYRVRAHLHEGKTIYVDITFIEDDDFDGCDSPEEESSYAIGEDHLAW